MVCYTIYDLVKTHAWRMLEWMLVQIEPSPYETKKLKDAGITSPTLASYCVWRRTVLMLAWPSLACWGVSSLSIFGGDMAIYAHLNWLGKICSFLPSFAGLFLTAGAMGALWHWTHPVRSNAWVMVGWFISLALPFLPAFFPMRIILTRDTMDMITKEGPAYLQLINTSVAVAYMAQLVPIFVSIPLGMVRASLRIRGLLPDNSLAGWILIVTLPLKAMVLVLGLVLASQVVGDMRLIVALALYIVGPLVYMWNRKLYTDPIDNDWEERVQKRQAIVRFTGLAGLILLLVWLFRAKLYGRPIVGLKDADGDLTNAPLYTYFELTRLIFEFLGRTYLATLCFADLFLRAALANWSSEMEQRQEQVELGQADERDRMYIGMQAQLAALRRGKNHTDNQDNDNDDNGATPSQLQPKNNLRAPPTEKELSKNDTATIGGNGGVTESFQTVDNSSFLKVAVNDDMSRVEEVPMTNDMHHTSEQVEV